MSLSSIVLVNLELLILLFSYTNVVDDGTEDLHNMQCTHV